MSAQMNDLWGEICRCQRLLDLALRESRDRGRECVRAEAEYYSQKARTAFSLKEEGYSASMIEIVIKGVPEVSEKMSVYHATQVEYENAREARNVYKKKLDTLREEYAREWSQAGTRD